MSETITSNPLCWPPSRKRSKRPEKSRFRPGGYAATARSIRDEVRRLGGTGLIISMNLPLRNDGLPYSSAREPDDSGVAVYFRYEDMPVCMACDDWRSVSENLHAIAKTIEAIRGISRWGSGDMMRAAFSGFQALPAPLSSEWWEVLGCDMADTHQEVEEAYRIAVKRGHPDFGGSVEEFQRVREAWETYRRLIDERG